MPDTTSVISLRLGALQTVDVDLLVVPWFEEEPLGAFSDLDRAAAGELSRALGSREFTGRAFDLYEIGRAHV